MNIALSDTEMKRYVPNLVSYDEIEDMNEHDLLQKLPLIVLYLNAKDSGHWVLVHRVGPNNMIEFFDSYGYKVDQEFKFIPDEFKTPKYLAKLLCKIIQTEPISYNQYQFQSKEHGINTCGRHCIVRNMFSSTDIDTYKKGIDKVCNDHNITPDKLVTLITLDG